MTVVSIRTERGDMPAYAAMPAGANAHNRHGASRARSTPSGGRAELCSLDGIIL